MRYLSVCSGIEGATVAWHPLGWQAAAFSEIEPFPKAVLKHHYPDVPNLGDMEEITDEQIKELGPIDLLVGGTPCQSFSVAGLRKGMECPRGNLALRFVELAHRTRARWVVWENVPGVLSSNGGRDFGSFLGGLGELGYGFAYRVLDAQYFGLAQRRRRVFVVGCLGDWARAGAVLFERSSLSRHPPSREEARSRIAAGTLSRALSRVGGGDDPGANKGAPLVPEVAWALQERDHKGADSDTKDGHLIPTCVTGETTHALDSCNQGKMSSEDGTGRGVPICFQQNSRSEVRKVGGDGDIAGAVAADPGAQQQNYVHVQPVADPICANEQRSSVRRLTPTECCRLQGFPDDYLDIEYRKKPAKDGPKYKALGNSFPVPVVRWIGERIALVEEIQ